MQSESKSQIVYSSAFRIGWIIILSVALAAIVLGIAIIIPPLDPGAEEFMGKSLSEIRAFSARVADWVWHENKESVFSFILLGVAVASMTWNALRKGEKWAWYTVVLLVVGYDLTYISIHASIGYLTYIPVAIILLIAFMVGAVLTARSVFKSAH